MVALGGRGGEFRESFGYPDRRNRCSCISTCCSWRAQRGVILRLQPNGLSERWKRLWVDYLVMKFPRLLLVTIWISTLSVIPFSHLPECTPSTLSCVLSVGFLCLVWSDLTIRNPKLRLESDGGSAKHYYLALIVAYNLRRCVLYWKWYITCDVSSIIVRSFDHSSFECEPERNIYHRQVVVVCSEYCTFRLLQFLPDFLVSWST